MGRWEDEDSLLLPKPAGDARGLLRALGLWALLKNSQSLRGDECKPNSPRAAVPCLACSPLLGPLLLWTAQGSPTDREGLLALLGCC